jgi:hypothetical protein
MTDDKLAATARVLKMRGMTQEAAWVAAQIKGE